MWILPTIDFTPPLTPSAGRVSAHEPDTIKVHSILTQSKCEQTSVKLFWTRIV